MNVVLAVLSTGILILLILMWLRANRRRRCRACKYFMEDYTTSLQGRGIYRFAYCQRQVHDCKVVEPDIERECDDYESIPQEAARSDTKAAEGHKEKSPPNPKVSIFTPGKGGK